MLTVVGQINTYISYLLLVNIFIYGFEVAIVWVGFRM